MYFRAFELGNTLKRSTVNSPQADWLSGARAESVMMTFVVRRMVPEKRGELRRIVQLDNTRIPTIIRWMQQKFSARLDMEIVYRFLIDASEYLSHLGEIYNILSATLE